MYKYVFFVAMFFVFNLDAQLINNTHHFKNCKETYKVQGDTCVDHELKNFIYEKIIKSIPENELAGKKNLKLNLNIDSTSSITSCFLSWSEGPKYFIKDVQTKFKKVQDFICTSKVSVHYTISENRSKNEAKIYSHLEQIFKVVEVMPSSEECKLGGFIVNDCSKTKLFSEIRKNLPNNNLNTGTIVFAMTIQNDGYIGDVQIYKNMAGENADKLLLEALNKLKKQKMRFIPGFQRNGPVDVLLTLTYDFDASKK